MRVADEVTTDEADVGTNEGTADGVDFGTTVGNAQRRPVVCVGQRTKYVSIPYWGYFF